MGRTTTHEVGHYLNCWHIWGDESSSEDPCSLDDNVTDTPNQMKENSGVPTFPDLSQSCPNTGPNGTMFMNFMDYTHDSITKMFTAGQVIRMHATLKGPRESLLQSNALVCFTEESKVTDAMKLQPYVYDGIDKMRPVVDML